MEDLESAPLPLMCRKLILSPVVTMVTLCAEYVTASVRSLERIASVTLPELTKMETCLRVRKGVT